MTSLQWVHISPEKISAILYNSTGQNIDSELATLLSLAENPVSFYSSSLACILCANYLGANQNVLGFVH